VSGFVLEEKCVEESQVKGEWFSCNIWIFK